MSPYVFLKCNQIYNDIIISESEVIFLNKEYALKLLKEKINGQRVITYEQIVELTGYSKRHLIRLSIDIENRDIDSMLIHANTGEPSHNSASNLEIGYIKEFKKQYPNISISQFMDIYHEDIIFNSDKLENIYKYNLKNVVILSLKIFIVITDINLLENIDVSKVRTLIPCVNHLREGVF